MTDAVAADRRAARHSAMQPTSHNFHRQCPRRARRTRRCSARSAWRAPAFPRAAPQAIDRAAGIRGAARRGQGDQGPHARPSRLLPRALREKRHRGRRHGALGAQRGRGARRGARHLPLGRRQDRHQGQVDGRRGDRASTTTSKRNGITPVETDLGEYIIQLRHEPPSHIIAPAIHLMKEQVADDLPRRAYRARPRPRCSTEAPQRLCDEARTMLRPQFLAADVGITGANFLVAETGSSIIVTNEGNGDLTQTLPQGAHRRHQPRKDGADAGGRRDPAAPAGALGDRAGVFVLHDDVDRPAPAGRSRRARAIPCRAARQWPHRRCSAASSRTCCAACAAPPASTIARSMPRSAGMPMAGSIPGRWGRC